MGDLFGGRVGQIPGHRIPSPLPYSAPAVPCYPLPKPSLHSPPFRQLALGRPGRPTFREPQGRVELSPGPTERTGARYGLSGAHHLQTVGATAWFHRSQPLRKRVQALRTFWDLRWHNQPILMARRWAGQWDQAAIRFLQPDIARCTRKQIKAVLGHIGRVTSATATTCWRDFTAIVKDLSPPLDPSPPPAPTGARHPSTIEWDPRLGEDHG